MAEELQRRQRQESDCHDGLGRMDVIIHTSNYIYIIECKLDGSAEEALQQIEAKNYAAPFAMDKRTIIKLGINFSSKTRGVESWEIG